MNATTLITLPLLIPLATAVLCVMLWPYPRAQRWTAFAGSVLLFLSSIALLDHAGSGNIDAVRLGGWPEPVAITLVCDVFSAIMVFLNATIAIAASIYALGGIPKRHEELGYHPLMQSLVAACSGAFLTGDLFNLYVWFEVMLLSSFVLLALGGTRPQLEGAVKYVTLNLLSSILFLSAIGLTYGLLGTLNLADLSNKIADSESSHLYTPVFALLFVAFAIKGGLFPFFFWLPASYHTPPPIVSAVFAGMLTKVGIYAIIRTTSLLAPGTSVDGRVIADAMVWIAGLTMIVGVLGAAVQSEIRRILSFHIVSQVGYMLMGLAIAGVALAESNDIDASGTSQSVAALAMSAAVFYILHHIIVKANLFFIAGIIEADEGTGELASVGGLFRERPALAALFFIPAMSLAGIPILSGFWAKFALVRAGVEAETFGIVAAALAVGLLTLYSMTKIWAAAFWTPRPERDPAAPENITPPAPATRPMFVASALLAAMTLAIGIGAGPAFDLAQRAGQQLVDTTEYKRAALNLSGKQSNAEDEPPSTSETPGASR